MSLASIIAQYADVSGCGHYRIIQPAEALKHAALADVCLSGDIGPIGAEGRSPQSVIIQMLAHDHQRQMLSRLRDVHGTKLVQDLDDLITYEAINDLYPQGNVQSVCIDVNATACMSDRLIVSTQPLADAYRKLNADIIVVPNRIDWVRWHQLVPDINQGAKPRIGWAGGGSHLKDLEMIREVVECLADEVDWVFFGFCPDSLQPFIQEFHHGVTFAQYPAKLAQLGLDLALAPLVINPFNEAKSNLKLLEYGVLGYPVLCTDIYPYQCDLPVERLPNQAKRWTDKIRELLADRNALAAQGQALRASVMRDWLLQDHLQESLAAWLS